MKTHTSSECKRTRLRLQLQRQYVEMPSRNNYYECEAVIHFTLQNWEVAKRFIKKLSFLFI